MPHQNTMAGRVIASLFAGATATDSSFVPFPDFLQNLQSTTFADILAQNSSSPNPLDLAVHDGGWAQAVYGLPERIAL